jgi:type IV pilus assembly protein PilV
MCRARRTARLPRRPQRAPSRPPRGVSLVEVLVSVLVVALGMLGAVALQASALRNNQGSWERTQTSLLTQGMLDAMRANPAGVTAGQYATTGYLCSAPTGTTLASRDLARWIGNLQAQIHPGACGEISCLAGACTVRVRWDDSRASGGSSAQTVTMAVQL